MFIFEQSTIFHMKTLKLILFIYFILFFVNCQKKENTQFRNSFFILQSSSNNSNNVETISIDLSAGFASEIAQFLAFKESSTIKKSHSGVSANKVEDWKKLNIPSKVDVVLGRPIEYAFTDGSKDKFSQDEVLTLGNFVPVKTLKNNLSVVYNPSLSVILGNNDKNQRKFIALLASSTTTTGGSVRMKSDVFLKFKEKWSEVKKDLLDTSKELNNFKESVKTNTQVVLVDTNNATYTTWLQKQEQRAKKAGFQSHGYLIVPRGETIDFVNKYKVAVKENDVANLGVPFDRFSIAHIPDGRMFQVDGKWKGGFGMVPSSFYGFKRNFSLVKYKDKFLLAWINMKQEPQTEYYDGFYQNKDTPRGTC